MSGIVAAGAALAVGELIAAFLTGAPSPIAAVGAAVIDFAPPGSKDVAVALFGTNDKPAILVLVTLTVLAVGAGLGLLARRRLSFAMAGIVALVGVGLLAMLRLPEAELTASLLSAAIQAIVGIQVLTMLLGGRAARRASPRPPRRDAGRSSPAHSGSARWRSSAAGSAGSMVEGRATQVAAADTEIPQPVQPVSAPGPESSFDVAGITPLVVPNGDFYRIDTALVTPSVNLATWNLRVHGMVDTEVSLTFDQLVELPLIEQYVTIACVSNEVGGNLVGNAKWTGVRLTDVLDMAGVHAEATQIVPRSVDGWTAGFPTAWVTAPDRAREAMIAVKMNDEPLPAAHGFPARLIVPGLYGYVSATKWLSDIELDDARGVRRVLGAAWLGEGGADPDPVADRRARLERRAWARDRSRSRASPGHPIAGSAGSRSGSTMASGRTRRSRRPIGPQTWVQWKWTWQADARRARDRRPGDRWRGRGADRPGHAAGPRRRPRLPHDPRARSLRRASGTLNPG